MPMTKTELINQVADDTGLTKIDVGKVLDVTINVSFLIFMASINNYLIFSK